MLNDLAALYTDNLALFAGSVFVFGLVIGSFLNVVIYRLPIMLERDWRAQAADLLTPRAESQRSPAAPAPLERFTLSTPGSACPDCKAPIKAWQNIPVVSWLVLRGRCAACKAKISAALSPGGTGHRLAVGLGGLAFRLWRRGRLRAAGHLELDRAHRHRYRSSAAARRHYPAADVGRPAGRGHRGSRGRQPDSGLRARCASSARPRAM